MRPAARLLIPLPEMPMKDLMLRMAQQIQRRLQGQTADSHCPFVSRAASLLEIAQSLQATWRRFSIARQRGWQAAGQLSLKELFQQGWQLHGPLTALLNQEGVFTRPQPTTLLSLREIYDDLRQLAEEFEPESAEFKPSSRESGPKITVRTSSIELDDVDLGPFAIELAVHRLHPGSDAGCFHIRALEPNPAASDSNVTHPHVSSGLLCAGDAAAPISQALRQGRISDAFLLVRSVLQTYNPQSPYVSLEDWHGISCPECGESAGSNGMISCDVCGHELCEHCMGTCALCDKSVCDGCRERDSVSRLSCCPTCRSECKRCGRIVDNNSFIEAFGLCPGCDQKAQEEAATEAEAMKASRQKENPEPITHLTEDQSHEPDSNPTRSADTEAAQIASPRPRRARRPRRTPARRRAAATAS